MATSKMNFRASEGVETFPCTSGNRITKSYYAFLVGEINAGTIKAAVCKITLFPYNVESYYLISKQ